MAKMTDKGREYVSRKIEKLRDEGYGQKQAVAMAHEYARKRGYKTPKRPKK